MLRLVARGLKIAAKEECVISRCAGYACVPRDHHSRSPVRGSSVSLPRSMTEFCFYVIQFNT